MVIHEVDDGGTNLHFKRALQLNKKGEKVIFDFKPKRSDQFGDDNCKTKWNKSEDGHQPSSTSQY